MFLFYAYRFDTSLLSYMKFAIEEEEMKIKAIGSDPVRFPSKWLQILQIISQVRKFLFLLLLLLLLIVIKLKLILYVHIKGVFAELESRFERLLEPLLLVAVRNF